MVMMTRREAADRAAAYAQDALRALAEDGFEDARDFLDAARGQAAAIVAMPAAARRVPLPAEKDPRYSASLSQGLAILSLFPTPANGDLLGVAEVADRLGMSRSTVHRYLTTLVLLGQLEQAVGRKYRRPEIEDGSG